MNFNPWLQWEVFSVCIHVVSIFSTSWFTLSTLPWLWLCLGFPWTILSSGYISLKLETMLFMNSCPLSDYKINGPPISVKIPMKLNVISSTPLYLSHLRVINLVKWSWYINIHFDFLSECDWKSMSSTWHRKLIGEIIG